MYRIVVQLYRISVEFAREPGAWRMLRREGHDALIVSVRDFGK
jgi:hypothetical protein